LDHQFADVKPRSSYNYHKQFTLAQVIKATSNFKDRIGEGGSSRVYYGILPNGQEVAVKVSISGSHHWIEGFSNEVHNNF
jgi:RIO-like serine/threonine protein kinase